MPNQAKIETVSRIKEDLKASDAIWIVDNRGLTVKQAEDLRARIRALGASYKVYKNSLTEFALDDLDYPNIGGVLEGPSAFVFVSGDPVASAKVLKGFAKENEKLKIKGGFLNKEIVTAEQIRAIADLPSREELIAKLIGTIRSPLSGVVQVLNGPASKLVRVLGAISEKAA